MKIGFMLIVAFVLDLIFKDPKKYSTSCCIYWKTHKIW